MKEYYELALEFCSGLHYYQFGLRAAFFVAEKSTSKNSNHMDYEVRVRLQITFNTLLQDIYSNRDHSYRCEEPDRIELAEKIGVNESVR